MKVLLIIGAMLAVVLGFFYIRSAKASTQPNPQAGSGTNNNVVMLKPPTRRAPAAPQAGSTTSNNETPAPATKPPGIAGGLLTGRFIKK